MTKTHTIDANTPARVIIPNPDLLDLVKKNLPGDTGISAMYSIVGSLSFRIARLAGMVANALAADSRKRDGGIDSYNDAMSFIDSQEAAADAFESAGSERVDMIANLRQLISYRQTANDYLAKLVGESKLPETIWADILVIAAEPAPVDQWKLDYEWETYTQGADADPQMTREEYDILTTRELSGQRSTWAKHINTVNAVIDAATTGADIEFFELPLQTQLSLLSAYSTPERMDKFRVGIMKRARGRFEADSNIRLHKAFVADCKLACLHHRYDKIGDKMVPKVEPVPTTAPQIAAANKARLDAAKNPHSELIDEAKDAERRAEIQAKLDAAKPAKAKTHKARVKAKVEHNIT